MNTDSRVSGINQGTLSEVATPPLSNFWLSAWSLTLAVGWLLPNHYPPWSTFHFDAWAAIAFLIVALAVILRSPTSVQFSRTALLTAALVFLPPLQYAFGLITLAGNAWISSAYLLGFLLAQLIGERWESASAMQSADGLFLSIAMAALLSVGLQLHQWLALDRLDIWSMGEGYGRPFANFGQPNQLGTFLLWGLLATLWGYLRRQVGAGVAILMSLFLLFGLALTASRTAWVAMALLVLASWAWRRIWPSRSLPLVLTCLGLYFVGCASLMGWLTQSLMGAPLFDAGAIARIAGESRPAIWLLFGDAALQRPWLGYGWNQVALAQMAAALSHPGLQMFFSQSHNLFLDLVLWCGVPVGASVSIFLMLWVFRRALAVKDAETATLVLLILVVANHAMLELPLHYAYFLLPVGLVMGALDVRLGVRPAVKIGRWVLVAIWLVCASLVTLIVRDYAHVESSYQSLRFEWANVKTAPAQSPDVILLTQWREFFRLVRFEPSAGMTDSELAWMRDVTGLYPSSGFFQKLSTALALNNRPDEAALWLRRMCVLVPVGQCRAVKTAWENQSKTDPLIAKVAWPN